MISQEGEDVTIKTRVKTSTIPTIHLQIVPIRIMLLDRPTKATQDSKNSTALIISIQLATRNIMRATLAVDQVTGKPTGELGTNGFMSSTGNSRNNS